MDISLVADPNLNSEQSLVTSLERLRLVVDSPEGLYPGTAERRQGDLVIKDLDGDGQSELEATLELNGLGRLPLVRIERGGLEAVTMEMRMEGFAPVQAGYSESIAAGGLQGIRFSSREILLVTLPFNLKPRFLPPRVTQVFPEDGSADSSKAGLSSVLVVFSKAMNLESLRKPHVLRVLLVNNGSESVVPAKAIQLGELFAGGPTKAEYIFDETLGAGMYRVRVSTEALDGSGRHLDQVAMQDEDQPFSSQFSVTGVNMQAGPECAVPPCETDPCSAGGLSCPQGSTCNTDQGSCEPATCSGACDPGRVCDPTLVSCVTDCRVYGTFGGCPQERPVCRQEGLCAAQ